MNYDDKLMETYIREVSYVLKRAIRDDKLRDTDDPEYIRDVAIGLFRKIWKREPKGLASLEATEQE